MRSRDRVSGRDFYRGDSADVSLLLDSLLVGYDKRLRPNYSGKYVYIRVIRASADNIGL